MHFNCPACSMQLMAEPQMSGQIVHCPGCNTKIQVPAFFVDPNEAHSGDGSANQRPVRNVWKEQDPTNPNALLSSGIGLGITVVWFAIIYWFQAPPEKVSSEFTSAETLANLFYKHFTVSFANTLFFGWAAAILFLKTLKLKHQRRAMLLDVLPMDLGAQINASNVGLFIDHVYSLPERLRDSLMVNRIRKALEFFEVRQNVADVGTLMSSQSAIDGSRIMGSYIIVRAFLWAIPLLGFIGTVVGLSHAISGMSFSNVEDVSKIVGSINNVTSGLGTAFDATLLGLVFAVVLNFPLNSLAKHEEEALNDIDAYCNEVLLPRLDDGAAAAAAEGKEETKHPANINDLGGVAEAMVQALTAAQREFLTHLDELSGRMLNYANAIEERNEQYHQAAVQHLGEQMTLLNTNAQEHMALVRAQQETVANSFAETVSNLEQSTRGVYESMVQGHNAVVSQFTEKLDSISGGLETALTTSVTVTEKAVGSLGEHVGKLDSASREYHQSVKAAHEGAIKLLAEKVGEATIGVEQSLKSTLESTNKTVGSLESSLRSLNTVLTDLGAKQVVIQQVKKKGWFSRGE